MFDGYDNELLEISPENGTVLSTRSSGAGNYHGIAVDPGDGRTVVSDVGGIGSTPDSFLMLNGGTNNTEYFLNYKTQWGYSKIEAISFFQAPFVLLGNQLDLFAADGTRTIYGLNLSSGQTAPVTDAPWPVRNLAFDLVKREVFYLRGDSSSFTLGSFNRDTYFCFVKFPVAQASSLCGQRASSPLIPQFNNVELWPPGLWRPQNGRL